LSKCCNGEHRMTRVFSSLRPYVNVKENPKFCVSCGKMATKEALFDVEDAMIIEKYCDKCAEKEAK
jgi:hypothetical protein